MAASFPGGAGVLGSGVPGSRFSALRVLTLRGWSLLACGAVALVLAWLLGRRELLSVAVFLVAAPLAAAAALRVGFPRLQVRRSFATQRATANRETAAVVEIEPPATGTGRLPPEIGRAHV